MGGADPPAQPGHRRLPGKNMTAPRRRPRTGSTALCQDADYIRRYRIAKDMKWVTATAYGDLDITINLSKPEKDPKAIAAAKAAPQSGYPKCQLCRRTRAMPAGWTIPPGRTPGDPRDHRREGLVLPVQPLCLLQRALHRLQRPAHPHEDRAGATFRKLLDFVKLFPHYFVGSNADLPIVGGFHPQPRPLPGGPLHLRHGAGPGGTGR